jgi:ABC-type Fe3+/spermidine/putrescine transport system ATPase subunit
MTAEFSTAFTQHTEANMSIRIEQVTKLYQGVPVVNDVTIEIQTGEFFVLLGPSGSGKSTLLRSLAGLTAIDHGRISLHGRDVTELPARERGVGMVFQHYALFRHMTVAENIEFALRVRRVRAAERRRRRAELLQLVALEGYDERFPSQLSGGQQQRVAVARALAHEPAVLLLDEPFGALDAKIRVELRETVRAVQQRIGMTTILVTHDQEEAFSLADRIGVMQMGRLLETGSPEQLYRQPATRFVARFLGAANLFLGEVSRQGLHLGAATLAPDRQSGSAPAGTEAVLVVRPEDIEVKSGSQPLHSDSFATGVVRALTFAGHQQHLNIALDALCGVEPAVTADGTLSVDALRSAAEQEATPLRPGDAVTLGLRRLHALPTPISSFHLMGADAATAASLEAAPLLAQLVRSMQARVIRHYEAAGDERLEAGICVLPLDANARAGIGVAVARGARRVLLVPTAAGAPTRMLVHAADAVRRSELLALVSSLMRHLPVEASAVTLQHPEASRSEVVEAQRALLDTRAELRGAHGLDLRSERFVGELPAWLANVAAQPEPVLVVFGLDQARPIAARLDAELAPLLATGSQAAVLLALGAVTAQAGNEPFGLPPRIAP